MASPSTTPRLPTGTESNVTGVTTAPAGTRRSSSALTASSEQPRSGSTSGREDRALGAGPGAGLGLPWVRPEATLPDKTPRPSCPAARCSQSPGASTCGARAAVGSRAAPAVCSVPSSSHPPSSRRCTADSSCSRSPLSSSPTGVLMAGTLAGAASTWTTGLLSACAGLAVGPSPTPAATEPSKPLMAADGIGAAVAWPP